MHIDVIDTLDGLERLAADWDAIYAADPEANFFLSRTWLWPWLAELRSQWLVLAARPDADAAHYVAVFPIRIRTRQAQSGGFFNEIAMAGNRAADYTGLLCRPEHEATAIPALAEHVKTLRWTFLRLEGLRASDARLKLLSRPFAGGGFVGGEKDPVNPDGINNAICPYRDLPDDFEAFVGSLTPKNRAHVRRILRAVDTATEFRVTHASPETFERDLAVLLALWSQKWGDTKGDKLDGLVRTTGIMLRHCFEAGALLMPVLWHGDIPKAVHASFIDRQKRALLFVIGGRDETFNRPQPGLTLIAHSIRHAISQGLTRFDFCRGNEPYKYAFGATEQRIRFITLATADRQNLGGRLEPASLPVVQQLSLALLEGGKHAEAAKGFHQILRADPGNDGALAALARIEAIGRGAAKTAAAIEASG